MTETVQVGDRIRWTYDDLVNEITVDDLVQEPSGTVLVRGSDFTRNGVARPIMGTGPLLRADRITHSQTGQPVTIVNRPTPTAPGLPVTRWFRGPIPGLPGTDVLVETGPDGGRVAHVYANGGEDNVTVGSTWSFGFTDMTPSTRPWTVGDRIKVATTTHPDRWAWKGVITSISDGHFAACDRVEYDGRPDPGVFHLDLTPDHLNAPGLVIAPWEESEMSDSPVTPDLQWESVTDLDTLRPGDWIKGTSIPNGDAGGEFIRLDPDGDPIVRGIAEIPRKDGYDIGHEYYLGATRTWYRAIRTQSYWVTPTEPLTPGTEFRFIWSDGDVAYQGIMEDWTTRRVRLTDVGRLPWRSVGWSGVIDAGSGLSSYRVRANTATDRPLAVGDIIRGPAANIGGDFTARIAEISLRAGGRTRFDAHLVEIHRPSRNGRADDQGRMGGPGYFFWADEVVRVDSGRLTTQIVEPLGKAATFRTLLEAKKAVHEFARSQSTQGGGPQCNPGTNAFLADLDLPQVTEEVEMPDERAQINEFMANVRQQVINHQNEMGRSSADKYLAEWGLEPIDQPTKTVTMSFQVPGNTTLDSGDIRDRVLRVIRSAEHINVTVRQTPTP